jgi:zinc protease
VAALRIRLREVLREDMGGVYGVGVFVSIARRPLPQYNVGITFGCAPERVDDLKRAVSDVVAAFQKGDIEDGIVEKVKEQQTRERETDVRENDFWLGELADSYRYGTDPLLILSYDELVKSVSNDRIAAAAKRYLDASHYLIGTLEPEAPAH